MFGLILVLIILGLFLKTGFAAVRILFSIFWWFCIKLPIALMICTLGLICCCTIILLPMGMELMRIGMDWIWPRWYY